MQGGSGNFLDVKKSRERAITLAGDEAKSKPPTPTPTSRAASADPSQPLVTMVLRGVENAPSS
jgi:hypothetical protein